MNIDKTRQFGIDNEKGVFLFLIVLGHLGNIPDSIRWLLTPTDLLYVSAFFFLSGWLFRKEKIWIAQNGLPILGFHCLLSFYVDAFSKIYNVRNTEFVFCFKIVFIFSVLYFVIIPVLGRIKPKWWGVTNYKK